MFIVFLFLKKILNKYVDSSEKMLTKNGGNSYPNGHSARYQHRLFFTSYMSKQIVIFLQNEGSLLDFQKNKQRFPVIYFLPH